MCVGVKFEFNVKDQHLTFDALLRMNRTWLDRVSAKIKRCNFCLCSCFSFIITR